MVSFTSVVSLSAIIAAASSVYALPVTLDARGSICGTTPSGSGSQAPISTLTTVTTASACLAQCNSVSSCLSFVFGLVDGVDKCMLYAVAASSIPTTNSNLVAYDKACTSVPAVVPTTANPQGLATTTTTGSGSTTGNTGSTGSTSSTGNPGNTGTAGTTTTTTTTSNNNGGTTKASKQNRNVDIVSRAICGAAPTGPTQKNGGASPTQTVQTTTLAECKAKCVAAGTKSCQSYEFGNNQCKLFAVAASNIPAGTGAQSQVFDVSGC